MFIEVQETPNPHTLKFIPGVVVLRNGIKSFTDIQDASLSPFAQALLRIDGVKGVFFTQDFITITKAADQDWSYLKTIILSSIVDNFVGGTAVYLYELEENGVGSDVSKTDLDLQIIDMIEQRVRPAVAQDGGDIEFSHFDETSGTVYVRLQGSCSGCPSSTITLKDGIERMLSHYIPAVKYVEAIT